VPDIPFDLPPDAPLSFGHSCLLFLPIIRKRKEEEKQNERKVNDGKAAQVVFGDVWARQGWKRYVVCRGWQ
jgi:hypothetical protein